MKNLLIVAIIALLSTGALSMEVCPEGYTGNGTVCDAISCPEDCGPNAYCDDYTYQCTCNSGFTEINGSCVSLCQPACGPYEYCDGYYAYNYTDYEYRCVCADGFTGGAGNCVDIDECEIEYDYCSYYETCVNTNGSYYCIPPSCPEDCGPYGYCDYNTYECTCNYGFTGTDGNCVSLCQPECGPYERCEGYSDDYDYTDYEYRCSCDYGFTGEAGNCTDIDECERDYCDYVRDSECYNTIGSYECYCEEGYYRSYVIDRCIPIDGDVFRYEASIFEDPEGCDPYTNQYRRDEIRYTIQALISEYLCFEEKEDETGE